MSPYESKNPPLRPVQPALYGTGNRWAVLVGINTYEDSFSYEPLQVCVQDVLLLYKQLLAGGFDEKHIHLLTDRTPHPPRRGNILTALQTIANATEPEDLLLFYFSGHGEARQGEGYLIPRDGSRAALEHTAVPISAVKQIISGAAARAKVIILDACHSGTNPRIKGKRPMSAEFIHYVFNEATGLAILSSCWEDEYSYVWPEQQCSVFTYYLAEALQGKADNEERGFVTVQDVNRYVTGGVKAWAVQQLVSQTPRLHYLVSGDIMLVKYGNRRVAEELFPPDRPLPAHTSLAELHALFDQYVGGLQTLRAGRVHQALTEMLKREYGVACGKRALSSTEDFVQRYHIIPLHALLLYTSEDREIETYLTEHWGSLNALAGDVCDIYPIVDQFRHPQDVNAYTAMEELQVLRDADFTAYAQLPGLFFWDASGITEYVSFGGQPDAASIKRTFRMLFDEIQRNPTIASVTRAKQKLQHEPYHSQPEPLIQQNEKSGGKMTHSLLLRNTLYQILAQHTTDLDLREICLVVGVHYNRLRGDSHAERAFSLTMEMDNQNRLLELEAELRRRLPRRF